MKEKLYSFFFEKKIIFKNIYIRILSFSNGFKIFRKGKYFKNKNNKRYLIIRGIYYIKIEHICYRKKIKIFFLDFNILNCHYKIF